MARVGEHGHTWQGTSSASCMLRQAMKNAENRKLPIAVTNLQHDFGVTNELDEELQHCLISRTEGEAVEVVCGAEREPGFEQQRRLAALYDSLAAGRSLDDSRQILSPPKTAKRDDLSHATKAWENLEQQHRERTGDQLSKGMRLAILLSMCPADLERELTEQQLLFPDHAQMRAHIVTHAPMMMGNLNDEASNCDAGSDESMESKGKLSCFARLSQRAKIQRTSLPPLLLLFRHHDHQQHTHTAVQTRRKILGTDNPYLTEDAEGQGTDIQFSRPPCNLFRRRL